MSGRDHLTFGDYEYDATLDYIVTQTFANLAGSVGAAIEAKAGATL